MNESPQLPQSSSTHQSPSKRNNAPQVGVGMVLLLVLGTPAIFLVVWLGAAQGWWPLELIVGAGVLPLVLIGWIRFRHSQDGPRLTTGAGAGDNDLPEVEGDETMHETDDAPEQLVARYRGLNGKWAGVSVDLSRRTVKFDRCFLPRRFFGWMGQSAEMPLEEVLSVLVTSYRGRRQLTIATKSGKAYLPDVAENFDELHEFLHGVCRHTPPAVMTDNPLFLYMLVPGLGLGMAIGFLLTPTDASDGVSLLYFLLGGAIGGGVAALFMFISTQRQPH